MWSTLAGCLQHMPTLPRFLLKFLFPHNFWFVRWKIMEFVLLWSLYWGTFSQKIPKNLKIKWDQVTLPKAGLSSLGTISPLGVKKTHRLLPSSDPFYTKVETPIQRSYPFSHSMKPSNVDSVVFQKWVAWILFSAHEESILTTAIGGH
jgi:hypothetical protein